jgi:putative ABC transport system permease protein
MTALHRMVFRDLASLRGQALAISLVVACGVASFVSMRSTYRSLLLSQSAYYAEYRFADVFAQLKRAPERVAARIQAVSGVAAVETRVVQEVTLDVPGLAEPAVGRLVSIPEHPGAMLNGLFLRQGRYPEFGRSEEVLISEAFAEANGLKAGGHVDAILNGKWKRLRIVGIALSPEYIYAVRGGSILPDNRRFGILWMNRRAIAPAFDMDGAFNDVALVLARGAVEADVIAELDRLLEPYGCLGAYGRAEQVSHTFISDEIKQNRVSSNIVPAVFLVLAVFLLQVSLTRLIGMHRARIALLKAFGYSDLSVGMHYAWLALLMVAGGVAFGVLLGLWVGSAVTALYQQFYRFPVLRYESGAGLLLFAIVLPAVAAVIGAIEAVRRALALPPAEAMKPEPPAAFHQGLMDRLGLQRLLSFPARMIARNIVRRPRRALLSIVAISCGTALLMVGWFFYDSFRYVMDLQFQTIEREDLTVAFHNPRAEPALYALEHLPGVIRAEPFRNVPVRLRYGYRSRRLAILGIEPGSTLRRLLTRESAPDDGSLISRLAWLRAASLGDRLLPVELPADGLVLSEKLAEILGASPGDELTVDVLEGARPVRTVVLSGVVDEPLGLGAYMNLDALNRLMREGTAISGAELLADPERLPQLYTVLKRTPLVSGVSIREAAIKSFEDILAQSFKISTNVLIVFACVIAVATIYNGATIALSERANELASLRVLGFTHGEIRGILLGEQVALTFAAIPLGLVLGYVTCAILSGLLETDLYRLPLVLARPTYAWSVLVIAGATVLSALLVNRRLRRLDLLAVLKGRE